MAQVGAWIKLWFGQSYKLRAFTFYQVDTHDQMVSDLRLTFSMGSWQEVLLARTSAGQAFRLKPESDEAERISVDHISRAGSAAGGGGASTLTTQLGGMRNAIGMLHDRVNMLQTYLADVASGKVAPNQSILREVASLSDNLAMVSEITRFD